MATFIGFSTSDVCQSRAVSRPGVDGGIGGIAGPQPRLGKKFKLTDTQLVLRDFLNALSIKQGDKVGQPGYGTTLWNFIFDPNTADLRTQVENELLRIAALDPRLTVGTIQVFSEENGILIEMEISVNPFNDVVPLGFFLNRFDGTIQQLAQ